MVANAYSFNVPTTAQLLDVKNWFTNFQEIYTWGGPNMTYPMSDQEFLTLIPAKNIHSFVMLNVTNDVVAFGQYYNRLDKHHLGRLAVNPKFRGQGLAKVLVQNLLDSARLTNEFTQASLFVFNDNKVAYQCYQSLGFVEKEYPGPIPGNMQNCVYMVKSL